MAFGERELEHVGLAYTDETKQVVDDLYFTCKLCWVPLAKVSCNSHMMKKHGVGTMGWLCCKDGHKISNRRRLDRTAPPPKLFLTPALVERAELLSAQSLVAEPEASRGPTGDEAEPPSSTSLACVAPEPSAVPRTGEADSGLLQQVATNADAQRTAWTKELPIVTVKWIYLEHPAPRAKGDAMDDRMCGRAVWPGELDADRIPVVSELTSFAHFLKEEHNLKRNNSENTVLQVGRILGALTLDGSDTATATALTDVTTLVGFFISEGWKEFFASALVRSTYDWTAKMIDSLIVYCRFHIHGLSTKHLHGGVGPCEYYTNVLEQFVKGLNGGIRKRCVEARAINVHKKRKFDAQALRKLPDVKCLQSAVRHAYIILQALSTKFAVLDTMPPCARAVANACIAGAVLLDTFMGRSMEWEILPYEHLAAQLEAGKNFIVCAEHKTSLRNGELAKYLSPGLVEALTAYKALPRPSVDGNFFLPAQGGTKMCFHSCLRTFCKQFLPVDKTFPTVNLIRKWFHSEIMKPSFSGDKEKLMDLMSVVDAHSKRVQIRHYILWQPEDDVELAKKVVTTVLGETVKWPSAEQAKEFFAQKGPLVSWFEAAIIGNGSDLEEEQKDEGHDDDDDMFPVRGKVEDGWGCDPEVTEPTRPRTEATEARMTADGQQCMTRVSGEAEQLGASCLVAEPEASEHEAAKAAVASTTKKKSKQKETRSVKKTCNNKTATEKRKRPKQPTDFREVMPRRRKINPAFQAWIIEKNLTSGEHCGSTHCLPQSFFKRLRKEAIQAGYIPDAETGPKVQGMRQVLRDYFAAVSRGAPLLALKTSAGAPSASSEGSAGSNAVQDDVRRP